MSKYKVLYKSTETLQVVVEANSEEEAYALAKEMDGGEFDPIASDWYYSDTLEIPEEEISND